MKGVDKDMSEFMAWFLDNSDSRDRVDANKLRSIVEEAVGENAKDPDFAVKLVAWTLNKLNLEQDDYDGLTRNGFGERLGGFLRWLGKGKRYTGEDHGRMPSVLRHILEENREMENEAEAENRK